MWMGSRLGTTTGKGGLPKELLSELEKLRDELCWFKDDKFAGHLFKEIKENRENLERRIEQTGETVEREIEKLRDELCWFKDDKFAGHLFKEIKENCENLEREITEINRSLVKIDATLDDLKEIASR
jgi:transcription termination factor NusB